MSAGHHMRGSTGLESQYWTSHRRCAARYTSKGKTRNHISGTHALLVIDFKVDLNGQGMLL
eukprot:1726674-Rhodomonas_salina.2